MKHMWQFLIASLAALALASMLMAAFWLGRIDGALSPARRLEVPMCAGFKTQIRESPTGYVIGDVPAGAMVWFIKLNLPFAHVAYFDGSSWLEGTVSAAVLEVCR